MAISVGQYVMQRMQEWGVERIYAYPGDGINGILAGLRKNGDKPRFIQARHEELAAFMASAHAKFTGTVGVCMATSGPGAIHLLNGLYDAKMDHQPVVAIVGQSATTALGSQYQQEVDLAIAVQGRGERILRHRRESRGSAALRRSRVPHRDRSEIGHLSHLSKRYPGRGRSARSAAEARSCSERCRMSGTVHDPAPNLICRQRRKF